MPNHKLEDDLATVPFVAKNGYYQVGDRNFNFKFNALMHATRTQQDVTWEFNSDQFKALDWRTPLNVDIRSLYRLRAQQLRDRYDYLTLCFSGGSDSTTILKSFINNRIHLDEIICDWPMAHTSNWTVSTDPSPYNHISEWELAIRPQLQYVATHYPQTKITITDTTEDLTVEDHEHALTISHMGPYQSTKRYQNVVNRYSEINQKHANAAIIMGTDKPNVFIDRNVFCLVMCDNNAFFKTSLVPCPRVVEYFYWTADMPELIREQAHLIYQFLLSNPNLRYLFLTGREYGETKQNLIKRIIYPDWDNAIFQANKADSFVYSSQHAWIHRAPSVALDAWNTVLNSHFRMIDSKYFDFYAGTQEIRNMRCFYTRAYPIGVLRPV